MSKPKFYAVLVLMALIVGQASANERQWGVGVANWALFDQADRHAVHLTYTDKPIEHMLEIRPTLLFVWADEGQRYLGVGVSRVFIRGQRWRIGAAFHAGFIDNPGRLGHKAEYYTLGYLEYQANTDWAIRAELGHISNAGFGDVNPGSESAVVSLQYRY